MLDLRSVVVVVVVVIGGEGGVVVWRFCCRVNDRLFVPETRQ